MKGARGDLFPVRAAAAKGNWDGEVWAGVWCGTGAIGGGTGRV